MTCENTDDREQLSQMMFETFAVRQLMLVAQGALELFEHEWWSGVTVHLGGDTSYIMPVYEGSPIAHAITSYVDANLRSLSRWRSLPLTTRVNLAGVASQSLVSCCQSIYCARYRGHNHPPCVPVNGMHHLNLNVSLWMQRAADETECPSIDSEKLKLVNRIKEVALFVARSGEKQADTTYVATHSFTCASIHGSYVLMPESRPLVQTTQLNRTRRLHRVRRVLIQACSAAWVRSRSLAGS